MKTQYSIRELSELHQVTARTIRHYEEIGLLYPERKGSQRVFNAGDNVRLGLIIRGKRIGWSLNEIKEIINLYDLPEGEVKQTSFLLEKINERRSVLVSRQKDIKNMLKELETIEKRLAP